MAEVHLARDTTLGRKVALKFLLPEMEGEANWARRLRREARAGAALDHPYICKVYDTGRLGGRSFIAMEFIDGETLKDRLKQGPLPVPEVIRIALEMAEALETAHRQGIIHRDIKPSNIILTEHGHIKITDFGIAKRIRRDVADEEERTDTLTRDTSTLGTLPYMSPEQIKGESLDLRSDLFSFGVVLYEMLTGLNPFHRPLEAETIGAVLHYEPEPLTRYSPRAARFESCVRKLLSKAPQSRYQTSAEVLLALRALPVEFSEGEVSPYPGLAPFKREQAGFFFGREVEVEAMWKKLREHSLLGLIGSTGSGKTSFIRAGLAPALPDGWAIAVATPGRRPFTALADALAEFLSGDVEAVRQLLRFQEPDVAVSLVSAWRRRHTEAVIVIDQFEELFTLNLPEVQESFAVLLGRLVRESGARVLLSMRDDFLMRCHGFEPLRGVFEQLTPLGPPTGPALKRALVEPAGRCGYRFEDESLVSDILKEVEGERGAFPMLAFAASQMWDHRDRERRLLTTDSYNATGGVAGALLHHAEATLERIGKERIPLVRELFRNLVTLEGTRVSQDRKELLSVFGDGERRDADRILEVLTDARLLVSYQDPEGAVRGAGDQRIEIVHESLLTNWPRLVRWQAQDTEGARLRDELRQAARTWNEHGRPQDRLWSGTAYREYELWREHYPGGLTDLEEAFGHAMALYARRRIRRRRLAVAALLLLALAVAIATGMLWRRSVREARRAEAAKVLALGQLEQQGHPTAAVAYATRSLELADTDVAREFVERVLSLGPIARSRTVDHDVLDLQFSPDGEWLALGGWMGLHELWRSDGSPPVRLTAHGDDALVKNWFSPNGRYLVSFNNLPGTKRELRIWALPALTEVRRIDLMDGMLFAFHPRGILLRMRTGQGREERVELLPFEGAERENFGIWRWPDRGGRLVFDGSSGPRLICADGRDIYLVPRGESNLKKPRLLGRTEDTIIDGRFLPDGNRVAMLDASETISFWAVDGENGASLGTVEGPRHVANNWDFDSSGRWMGTANGMEQTAYVWDLAAPAARMPLALRRGNVDSTFGLAIHPDGNWVAVADSITVSLWALSTSFPRVLWRQDVPFTRIAFDPDGEWVAAASWDGKLRLWSLTDSSDGMPRTLYECPQYLMSLAVSPDGGRIAVGRWNGSVSIVPTEGGPARELTGFHSAVYALAFDSNGRRLAATGGLKLAGDRIIRVWELESGRLQILDPGDQKNIYELEFTKRGRLLSSGPGGLRSWNLDDSTSETLIPEVTGKLSPDGRYVLGAKFEHEEGDGSDLTVYDLETGERWPLPSHGSQIVGFTWHPSGKAVLSGSRDGVLRVGTFKPERTHLLFGQELGFGIAIDPAGKWIGSAGWDGVLRLWPMPDLSQPPLHTLPRDELLAKLKSLTNLRVVENESTPTGYTLEFAEFPGW
jgi:WD40 repeat protein